MNFCFRRHCTNTTIGSQVVSALVAGISDGTRLDATVRYSLRLTHQSLGPMKSSPVGGVSSGITVLLVRFESIYSIVIFFITLRNPFRTCLFSPSGGHGSWNNSGCNLTAYNSPTDAVTCELCLPCGEWIYS